VRKQFSDFIFEIAEYQLPLDLLYNSRVVDVKLRKMPSVYKTLPFNRKILLEFDISTLQQLKN